MNKPESNKRLLWFAVLVFLLASAKIGYAAVPQSTVLTTGAGITTYVGHYGNFTLGIFQGATERLSATGAATFTGVTGTSFIIGANTLTTAEWAFLDGTDQSLAQASSPTFNAITGTTFVIGVNTLSTSEWGYLDGVDQSLAVANDVNFSSVEADDYYLDGVNKTPIFKYPQQDYSYLITTDGTNYYAKNGTTGAIDYSGANASVVIQASIDAVPAGNRGGVIQFSGGIFTLTKQVGKTTAIDLASNPTAAIWLRGEGIHATRLVLANNQDCNVIEYKTTETQASWRSVTDLTIDGNKDNQSSGHGIYMERVGAAVVFDTRFHNVFVRDAKQHGWYLRHTWGSHITSCLAEFCGESGIYISGGQSYVDKFYSAYNGDNGIEFRADRSHLVNSQTVQSDDHGVIIQGDYNTIQGVYVGTWGQRAANTFIAFQVSSDSRKNSINGVHIIGDGTTNTYRGFAVDGDDNIFTENTIETVSDDDVYLAVGADNNIFTANNIEGSITDSGTGNKISDNQGYVTENIGTATVLNGTTSIVITHGLDYTPTSGNTEWTVSYLENPTNDCGSWYINTFTSTQATIHVFRDPGVSNLDIAWGARRNP